MQFIIICFQLHVSTQNDCIFRVKRSFFLPLFPVLRIVWRQENYHSAPHTRSLPPRTRTSPHRGFWWSVNSVRLETKTATMFLLLSRFLSGVTQAAVAGRVSPVVRTVAQTEKYKCKKKKKSGEISKRHHATLLRVFRRRMT